jgi:hypothetical protein
MHKFAKAWVGQVPMKACSNNNGVCKCRDFSVDIKGIFGFKNKPSPSTQTTIVALKPNNPPATLMLMATY